MGKDACAYERSGVLFNRVKHEEEENHILQKNALPLVHVMRENEAIRDLDRQDRSFFDLLLTTDLENFESTLNRMVLTDLAVCRYKVCCHYKHRDKKSVR